MIFNSAIYFLLSCLLKRLPASVEYDVDNLVYTARNSEQKGKLKASQSTKYTPAGKLSSFFEPWMAVVDIYMSSNFEYSSLCFVPYGDSRLLDATRQQQNH